MTEGIVRAWREGVVTSTSAMVNSDGALQRIAAVHDQHPDLPIGLHLNITTGRPVLPSERVPTLVDANGRFYSTDVVLARWREISLDELRAELHAQAELLLATGVRFDHIDYHEGTIVIFPPFYRLVVELARAYRVPVRQPVPEAVYGEIKRSRHRGAATVIRRMRRFVLCHPLAALRLLPFVTPTAFSTRGALLDADGIPAPNWFVEGFFGNPTVGNLTAMLRQLPPGVSEVAVHPGLVDEQLRELGGGYVAQRESELAVLLDRRLQGALRDSHVHLVDFSFLAATRIPIRAG